MNNVNAIVAGVIAALGGGSGIGVIIKQLVDAARLRAEAKKVSEDGHEKTQQLLAEVVIPLQAENAQLRADNETLMKANASLMAKNDRLTAALPPKSRQS